MVFLLSLSLSLSLIVRMNQESEEQIDLPPGFRFHPTDEELITHYLSPKVANSGFTAIAIGEADLNKSEPWDLPGRAKMGESEWYFFCVKDRKYPTGLRTNRATESGYWKATGKDKEILRGKRVVGMKKTLVFYKGRAPKGEKSNWVLHEYRLEGKVPGFDHLHKSTKNEWVICRIFNKSSGEKRTHISELAASPLPPLMDYSFSPYSAADARASHMTSFSNLMNDTKPHTDAIYTFKTPSFSSSSPSSSAHSSNPSKFPIIFPKPPNPPAAMNHQLEPDPVWLQGNSILRKLFENQTPTGFKPNPKVEFSPEVAGFSSDMISSVIFGHVEDDDYDPSTSDGQMDLESLWNI